MRFRDDETLYSVIGKNIKSYRNKAGFTQVQLADKVGISLSYITKIEAKKCCKSLSLSILNQIANALDVDITNLFKEE